MPYSAGYAIADIAALKALLAADLVNGYARWVISKNNWYGWNANSTAIGNDDSIIPITEVPEMGRFIKAGFVESPLVPTGVNLTFASNGDVNGLLYWLGTSEGMSEWVNPQSINKIVVTSSTVLNGSLLMLSDRLTSDFRTDPVTNAFAKIEIVGTKKLVCNYYSIRTWQSNNFSLRGWKLEGSNNNTAWDVLDSQSNNTSLDTNSKWLSLPVTSSTAYKFFRLVQTEPNSSGTNHLVLGEIELYGNYLD